MSHPDEEFGSTLRQLLLDAADEIHPTRRRPDPSALTPSPWSAATAASSLPLRARPRMPRLLVASFAAVIVVAAAALTISVRHSSSEPSVSGGNIPGELAVVRPSGVVQVMDPNTGGVLRTLVGSSPVGSNGKHLGIPISVTAEGKLAFITYAVEASAGSENVYSVPLAGGHLSYVAAGIDEAVSEDGSMLAYVTNPPSGKDLVSPTESLQEIIIRNLKTGSQRRISIPNLLFVEGGMSWSTDRSDLLIQGIYTSTLGAGAPVSALFVRIGVLSVDQPISSDNPHFIWSQAAQPAQSNPYDAHFIDGGKTIGLLSNMPSDGCDVRSTSLLTLNAVTGVKTPIGTLPFYASDAQYAPTGQPVAIIGFLPHCAAASTTTVPPRPRLRPGYTSGSPSQRAPLDQVPRPSTPFKAARTPSLSTNGRTAER